MMMNLTSVYYKKVMCWFAKVGIWLELHFWEYDEEMYMQNRIYRLRSYIEFL